MTEQERAESFLRKHTGLFFCSACLAHELNLTTFHGRSLLWKLQALPGYEMRGGKCVNCARGKRVLRHVGGFGILGPSGQVAASLLTNKGIELCDACLAFATELSLDEVRRVVTSLESLPEYERHDGKCTVCSRLRPVTAAVGSGESRADDTHDVAQIITGSVQYRAWRIDLLSYRTGAGWRPFILIKGPAPTDQADAPSLLWSTFRSQADADEHALKAARDWIDKHCSD